MQRPNPGRRPHRSIALSKPRVAAERVAPRKRASRSPRFIRWAVLPGLVLWLTACLDLNRRDRVPNAGMGGRIFETHCAACHQPDGSGAESGGPPLANSSWVRGPESRLIRIVLGGVRGSIEIDGQTYNREMLAFGDILADDEIATVLTFVRGQWGKAGPSVSAEEVSRIRDSTQGRTGFWSVDELLRVP